MKRLLATTVLVFAVLGLMLAQRTMVGTVSGDDGEVLIGATVSVKGATAGTRTDISGKYSVSVPAGYDVLVFSYTGYQTQEITLGASNTIDVVLAAGQILQEAVVTALGITRSEKALGYTVSKVDGNTITGSGEVNAIQALAAKGAGIQVVSSSGTPGASSKILIRGNSTLQLDNQPLIVVDNVPYDNQVNTVQALDYPFNPNLQGVNESNRALDINPADIESISVLKGPSASALYGTRAANGVILITTKKGAKGGLKVNYSGSFGVDRVNKLPDLQTSYGQGTGGGAILTDANGVIVGSTAAGNAVGNTPQSWGPAITQSFDNLDTYFQNGQTVNNNLSLSGGNDNTTFRFSYGNTNQTGIVPNTLLNRNAFRVNATTGSEHFKVNVSGAYTATQDNKAQNGSNISGVMLPLLRMPADFNLLGGDGTEKYLNADGTQYSYIAAYDNPLWSAYHNTNKTNLGRFTGSIGMDYLPFDWLTFTLRASTDIYNDQRTAIYDIGNHNFDGRGEIWESNNKHEEINTDFLMNVHKSFGDISTNLLVGSQLNHRSDQALFGRGRNLAAANFFNLKNASELYVDNSTFIRRIAGVFASLDLGYKELVYLTIGGRNDWASTFGAKAKNSFFYPNASLSFIPTSLMDNNDILSYLKIRASIAQAGREPLIYSSLTYYGRPTFTDGFTNGVAFPYLGQNGFVLGTKSPNILGNETLRPEINTSYEAGFDLRLWKNRVRAAFTYYNSKSTDLLVVRPVAAASGFSFYTSNAGEMRNKGIEIELDVDIVRSNSFTWTLGGNFTKNKNEVIKLAPGVDQFSVESAFTGIGAYAIAGQPYGAIYGTKWVRNDAGQLVIGANGLPQRDATEGFLGNPYPDYTAGIRNSFKFKGFTLSGLLDIRQGGILWNGTHARLNQIGRTQESADGRDKYYVIEGVKASDGTPNDIRISAFNYFRTFKGDGGTYAVENAIEDGSWIRLRELTLNYDLPKMKKVDNLSIYVTGRNLWVSTDYTGVDPETSLTGAGSNVGGFDYFNMPGARSYIVGIRAGF